MAGKVNYRIVTLVAALSGAVLSAIALAFMVTALVEYRADDFFTATTTKDFTTLGTCVETLTRDQLTELDYNNVGLSCKEDEDRGNRYNVINSLRATVHGVYYAYHSPNALVDDGSDTNTMVAANTIHVPGHYLRTVHAAQVAHVLGKQAAFGYDPATFENVGLNYSMVYEALALVDMVDVPVSCDDIYGLTFTDISNDHEMIAQSAATVAAGGAATIPGHFVDTEWELYIKRIRDGRLDSDGKQKADWPLEDFTIDCPGEVQRMGTEYIPGDAPGATKEVEGAALSDDQKKYMYAHCVAQFQFASVSTVAWSGTYGIPLPGIEPGPFWYPYPQADGFNSTSSYNTRTRMYLGQRFGLSVWAYVPMFLATCFLLGDCVVFFFTEALMPITLGDQYAFASNSLNNVRDSLVIMATTRSSRRKRLALGFVAVLSSILFYSIFIAAPWGFFYTSLPRPICEKSVDANDPNHVGLGTAPDHGVPQIGWKGTRGGWKTDYDATWYDLATLFVQVLVLALLPLTTTAMFRDLNKSINDSSGGRTTVSNVQQAATFVHNDAAYRFMQKVLVLPMVIGILVAIVGQSISGARFGMAWAEGVVAQEVDHEGAPLFDEVKLSEQVYDQTIATLAIVTVCGLVFAVAIQRHLINGVGCFSAGLFFGWVVLVIVFALPIMIYAASRSIFTESSASEDCATFPRSSHEFENDLCVARFWTLLVGGGLFLGTVFVITVLGLLEAFPALFAGRNKAAVNMPKPQELNPIMRSTGPANSVGAPFRSASEPFFKSNSKSKSMTPDQFLYGGRMAAPPMRR